MMLILMMIHDNAAAVDGHDDVGHDDHDDEVCDTS